MGMWYGAQDRCHGVGRDGNPAGPAVGRAIVGGVEEHVIVVRAAGSATGEGDFPDIREVAARVPARQDSARN